MAAGTPVEGAPAEAPEDAGSATAEAETAGAPEAPRADAPAVRVHEERLDRRVAPMELSPTEALRLASDGPAGLSRRELPPDTSGGSEGGTS